MIDKRWLLQAPIVSVWKILIYLSDKKNIEGMLVCDISSTQSKNREIIFSALNSIYVDIKKDKICKINRLSQYITIVAFADLRNLFEYYEKEKILLIDKSSVLDKNMQGSIKDVLDQVANKLLDS